jgi:hypothetical protein
VSGRFRFYRGVADAALRLETLLADGEIGGKRVGGKSGAPLPIHGSGSVTNGDSTVVQAPTQSASVETLRSMPSRKRGQQIRTGATAGDDMEWGRRRMTERGTVKLSAFGLGGAEMVGYPSRMTTCRDPLHAGYRCPAH